MTNQIILSTDHLPRISLCGFCQTEDGFVHPDRIMDVNVLLYVEKGEFRLVEETCCFTDKSDDANSKHNSFTKARSAISEASVRTDINNTMSYNIANYHVKEGSLIFLKQGFHHYGTVRCPKGTKWFFVHFHLPEEWKYATITDTDCNTLSHELMTVKDSVLTNDAILYQEMTAETSQCRFFALPKQVALSDKSRIPGKFAVLSQMFQSSVLEERLKLNAYLYQILLDIFSEGRHLSRSNAKEEKVRQLIQLLENSAGQSFDSQMLEAYMHLSFKHLNVLFKEITGTTLQKYHAAIRMKTAAKMLMETSMSIEEISDRLGFDSPYYFSNSFKKQYGISPSRFRREQIFI